MLATIALATTLLLAPGNDRPQIEALCAKIAKATATRDWKGLTALSTPDFKQHTLQGQTVKLKALTQAFDRTLKTLDDRKVTYKIKTFKSDGKVAKAEIYWSIIGTQKDMKGKKHTVEFSDSEEDTFKKIKGKWLEAEVREHTSVQKLDGKDMNDGAMNGDGGDVQIG